MKNKILEINEYKVLIVDAPTNATHSSVAIHDGANYIIERKSKMLGLVCFDESQSDGELVLKYRSRLVNVGCLKIADEPLVADLFTPVKHGNFYDYEFNGVFYPTSISALKDIIDQQFAFENPYVLIIKPF